MKYGRTFLFFTLWNPCPVLVAHWCSEDVGEGLRAHFCEEQLEKLGLLSLEA